MLKLPKFRPFKFATRYISPTVATVAAVGLLSSGAAAVASAYFQSTDPTNCNWVGDPPLGKRSSQFVIYAPAENQKPALIAEGGLLALGYGAHIADPKDNPTVTYAYPGMRYFDPVQHLDACFAAKMVERVTGVRLPLVYQENLGHHQIEPWFGDPSG